MGGMGSGNRYRGETTSKIEDYKRLDIRQLRQKGCLKKGLFFSWQWLRDDQPAGNIMIEVRDSGLLLTYRASWAGGEWQDIEELVPIIWTPCNFGGERPWFSCPRCGRRVGILVAAGTRFLCRHCYSLKYRCQSEDVYDRMRRKARKIRSRLGERDWLKPKGMHEKTFDQLRDKLADAEMRERISFILMAARAFPFNERIRQAALSIREYIR